MLGVRRRAAVRQPRSRLRAPSGDAHRRTGSRAAARLARQTTTTTSLQKRAALEVEAKHAALFDKKLAQEEVWIRQGVEARRTRNEGRVRALEQLRVERRERRERIGQVECAVQEPRPSGKLVFEARHVESSFGEARRDRGFLGAHHAR